MMYIRSGSEAQTGERSKPVSTFSSPSHSLSQRLQHAHANQGGSTLDLVQSTRKHCFGLRSTPACPGHGYIPASTGGQPGLPLILASPPQRKGRQRSKVLSKSHLRFCRLFACRG